jgi:hypothetical protein
LTRKGITGNLLGMYRKWLRYYLDFCRKYHFAAQREESLPAFIEKLHEKKQSETQRQQAAAAIKSFYAIHSDDGRGAERVAVPPLAACYRAESSSSATIREKQRKFGQQQVAPHQIEPKKVARPGNPRPHEERVSYGGVSWQKEYCRLADEIGLRHYSPKTLRNYRDVVRKFQTFTKSIDPGTLATSHVKDFLTYLAVKKQVFASTQNLAFNGLLFF